MNVVGWGGANVKVIAISVDALRPTNHPHRTKITPRHINFPYTTMKCLAIDFFQIRKTEGQAASEEQRTEQKKEFC